MLSWVIGKPLSLLTDPFESLVSITSEIIWVGNLIHSFILIQVLYISGELKLPHNQNKRLT